MKLEAAVNAFSPCADRFVTNGYKDALSFEQTCEAVSKLNIPAVPLGYDGTQDPVKIKAVLDANGLRAGTICPDNYTSREWKHGSLANRDEAHRRNIIRLSQESMDFCKEVGGIDTMLWLAHDGYDYCFEDDYMTRWGYIRDSLSQIASYRTDVNLTLEYKQYEPRAYQYIGNIGKALLMCNEVNLPNLGIIIDYGHALFGGENPAESVALASAANRLFHIHLNDNYRRFDDDMILGTVSFWETLEFFYQLDKVGYDGWYVIDIFPSRLDGRATSKEFVARAEMFQSIVRALPHEQIAYYQKTNDVPALLELLRKNVIRY